MLYVIHVIVCVFLIQQQEKVLRIQYSIMASRFNHSRSSYKNFDKLFPRNVSDDEVLFLDVSEEDLEKGKQQLLKYSELMQQVFKVVTQVKEYLKVLQRAEAATGTLVIDFKSVDDAFQEMKEKSNWVCTYQSCIVF